MEIIFCEGFIVIVAIFCSDQESRRPFPGRKANKTKQRGPSDRDIRKKIVFHKIEGKPFFGGFGHTLVCNYFTLLDLLTLKSSHFVSLSSFPGFRQFNSFHLSYILLFFILLLSFVLCFNYKDQKVFKRNFFFYLLLISFISIFINIEELGSIIKKKYSMNKFKQGGKIL